MPCASPTDAPDSCLGPSTDPPPSVSDVDLSVSIASSGDETYELLSLRDWLRADAEFTGVVDLAAPTPGAGEMGAVADTLHVLSGPGEAAALAAAVSTWLRTRKSSVRLRFHRGDREVEVSATNVTDVAQLIDLVKKESR